MRRLHAEQKLTDVPPLPPLPAWLTRDPDALYYGDEQQARTDLSSDEDSSDDDDDDDGAAAVFVPAQELSMEFVDRGLQAALPPRSSYY